MNVKEYLKQGWLLDQRINFNLRRLHEMKAGICGLSYPQVSADKVQTSPDGEAPFVKAIMRVAEMEEKIDRQIDLLVDLKQQIDDTIHSVDLEAYQMLLLYRYVENMGGDREPAGHRENHSQAMASGGAEDDSNAGESHRDQRHPVIRNLFHMG